MTYTLSIGTNIGNKLQQIKLTLSELNKIGTITAVSSPYTTQPWGFESENSFINIALTITTPLSPLEMLDATQAIERKLGRTTKSENGYSDRPIDIDLIYADNLIINTDRLTIPHPLMHKRNFVLIPLAEIQPQLIHPILKLSTTQLLKSTTDTDIPAKITNYQLNHYTTTK